MKLLRIDWRKVRAKMAEQGIRHDAQLARGAGIHANTMYNEGPFVSTVVERLANFLECDPCVLMSFEESPTEGAEAVENG